MRILLMIGGFAAVSFGSQKTSMSMPRLHVAWSLQRSWVLGVLVAKRHQICLGQLRSRLGLGSDMIDLQYRSSLLTLLVISQRSVRLHVATASTTKCMTF